MAGGIRPWRILESTMAFDEPWYRLRQDRVEVPDGTVLDDYHVARLALTPREWGVAAVCGGRMARRRGADVHHSAA